MPLEQTGEPGWLAGEVRGKTGWFPESYVEPVDAVEDVRRNSDTTTTVAEPVQQLEDDSETKRLEYVLVVKNSYS